MFLSKKFKKKYIYIKKTFEVREADLSNEDNANTLTLNTLLAFLAKKSVQNGAPSTTLKEKSRKRETLNLSTDVDDRTNPI